eukprot:gene16624-biopygen14337
MSGEHECPARNPSPVIPSPSMLPITLDADCTDINLGQFRSVKLGKDAYAPVQW